jgi:C4-dicarboxylate-specific signal transduction histidine kinase/GAF domain-containing protein
MTTDMRKTGVDVVGDIPWGTHFCLFYETTADLLETLVSYLKAGLENQEFCLWVVAEPLGVEDAIRALQQAVPGLDRCFSDHSIEIVAARDWYLKDGTFDLNRVIGDWNAKLARASARGYAGVRVTGDTAWLEKKNWNNFCEYEESLNRAVANQRLTVLCTYPLAACGAAEILDVVRTHQFAVTKRRGGWDVIETAGHKQAKAEIKRLNEELEHRVAERTSELTSVNSELTKEVIQRQRAEEALLRSETYLAEAQRVSHTGSFGWSVSSGDIVWSDETFRIFDYDPASKPTAEVILQRTHPEDRAFVQEKLEQLPRERKAFDFEHRLLAPDGSVKHVRVVGHPSTNYESGNFEFVGAVTDITKRKRAEALRDGESHILEMIAREAPLQEILQNLVRVVEAQFAGLLCSVLLLDDDGQHVRHGAAPSLPKAYIEAINGLPIGPQAGSCGTAMYRREPVVVTDILHDPLWEPYRVAVQPHGLRACWSTPILGHSGKALGSFAMYYREPRSPSATESRALEMATHLAGIAIERKQAREELQRSEAYLAEGQRLTHTGSWAINVVTRQALHSSAEHTRLFGFDPEKGIPSFEQFLERVHAEDREHVLETFRGLIRSEGDLDLRYRIAVPHCPVRYMHAIGHPVLKPSGARGEYVGIAIDITERRRSEQERERLRQAQADLAHMNRVATMGELTASLAHEIKQPITAAVTDARTCLRWLTRDDPDVAEAREAASRLVTDVTRAAEIISRISLLFKKGALQEELVDINELIREMIGLLRSEASRYSISIRGELANDLPKMKADRVQLQQVLMNLMLNGIEAMKESGTGGELTIKSQQDDNRQLLISVRDTGVGLEPEQAEQIFHAFFTTKPQGTGMGLPISRSIVESHGGRLWATSNSGPGATFQFTLPREVTFRKAA